MKTTIKIYKNENEVTTSTHHLFNDVNVKNEVVLDFINAKKEYAIFCKNQTKRGQARKNERARARKKIFSGLEFQEQKYNEIWDQNFIILKKQQPFILKDINIDGRLGLAGRRSEIKKYLLFNRKALLAQF